MIHNCELYFPYIAKHAISYELDVFNTCLIVKLENGETFLYDDVNRSIGPMITDETDISERTCRTEFGRRLDRMLLLKGMTQLDLSEATGIAPATINRYINSNVTPTYFTVVKIAKALGCSTDDFRYVDILKGE